MTTAAIGRGLSVAGYPAKATPAKEGLRMPASTIDAAPADGGIVSDRAFHEAVTNGFLPPVLFLGLGFLLSGVTFLLATIVGTLRDGGREIQRAAAPRSTW
jgi:hypothetical protein